MKLLVLCGESGAGKDTIADSFAVPGSPARIALGDRLRDVIREALPIGRRDLTEDKDRPIAHLGGITGRDVMRLVGRMLREVDESVWRFPVQQRLQQLKDGGFAGIAVVTDVRDPSDEDSLRLWAGYQGVPYHATRVLNGSRPASTHPYERLSAGCRVDSTTLVMQARFDAAAGELEETLRGVWPDAFPPRGGE